MIFMGNPIQFYNSLTKQKENFEDVTGKKPGDTVTMYNCGPTVYSNAHIGNLSAYLMADLIRRFLEFKGYEVKQVKNITDVGHLISDSDHGEDKLEKKAREEKKDPLEIAKYYEELYLEDEKKLNLKEPFKRPRASETIEEMIAPIKDLEKKGYTYETSDGIYFDVTKFEDYGKLSGNTIDNIKAGARVCVNIEKKHPADFALWKKLVGENENHILKWNSPWGEGFPGWHIECSAMASKYLGNVIDIHTGGEDNIFPHHECEIAQSRCANDTKLFSHFWIHKRHIQVEGEKMSKSLGNFYTLKDLEDKGVNPLDFRILMFMSHYRTRSNFTFNGLNAAKKFRERFNLMYLNLEERIVIRNIFSTKQINIEASDELKEIVTKYLKSIDEALCDDLNTPLVFSILNDMFSSITSYFMKQISSEVCIYIQKILKDIDKIFGILEFENKEIRLIEIVDRCLKDAIIKKDKKLIDVYMEWLKKLKKFPENIKKIVNRRQEARDNKEWQKSDELRDELKSKGYKVEDTSSGQVVTKI